VTDSGFQAEVDTLCRSLKLQPHPTDHLLTLHACCLCLRKLAEEDGSKADKVRD
jgi:hypothetical protein